MSIDPTDLHFNWVEARAACSLVLLRLRSGAKTDVDTRNKQLPGVRFGTLDTDGADKFTVYRDSPADVTHTVEFERTSTEIWARGNGKDMRATITFAANGVCRLNVDGHRRDAQVEEIEEWYFRKLALEWLLFGV